MMSEARDIESNMHKDLENCINAEIASGVVTTAAEAV